MGWLFWRRPDGATEQTRTPRRPASFAADWPLVERGERVRAFFQRIGIASRRLERPLSGTFEFANGRAFGRVLDLDGPRRGEIAIIARPTRGPADILAKTVVRRDPEQYSTLFSLDCSGVVTAESLVKERVGLIATNESGTSGTLQLDGASELQLIKEVFSVPHIVHVDIDFTSDGNSKAYVGSGWSYPEQRVTWAVGLDSVISFETPKEDGRYVLRMLLEPFLADPEPLTQRLDVYVNDFLLGSFELNRWHTMFFEISVPFQPFFENIAKTVVRFHHPDAVAPCRVVKSSDSRELSLAFRRLSLVRILSLLDVQR